MRYPTTDDHYGPAGPKINPWLSVWLRPRTTIRYILANNPSYGYWLIVFAYGFVNMLQSFESGKSGDKIDSLGVILAVSLIIGPPIVLLGVYISGWLMQVTGNWLGGRASQMDLRIASVWSYLPLTLAGLMYWPRLSVSGHSLFTSEFQDLDISLLSGDVATIEYMNLGVTVIAAIWTIVLASHMVAEVQGFRSSWRGFFNLLLPVMILLVIIVALAMMIISMRGGI